MKKTLTVNLSGIVYHIDEDAYQKLKNYLSALELKFRQEPDMAELISDIETRISELLTEKLGSKRQVVTISDIDFIIETLGDPDAISDQEESETESEAKTSYRNYRRMYRDPDDRTVGGVCSGLAAYWNIDPVILKVIFILLVIAGGSGILIYLILWIVLPEAKTTAQKLEMRGEAVTIDSMKGFIRDEFEQVKKNFKKKK
jgi:phage shock protein PspC (stress-responsive transcriptional regulator)